MGLLQCLINYEDNYHLVSYSRCCVPFEGNYIVYCARSNKSMYLSEKECPFWWPFQHYTTLLSNWIGPVFKHVPSCVLVLSREMTEIAYDKRFLWPSHWFNFGLRTALRCNNYSTLWYWSLFVMSFSHLIVPAPLCDDNFSKSHFVIAFSLLFNCYKLSCFLIMHASLCNSYPALKYLVQFVIRIAPPFNINSK